LAHLSPNGGQGQINDFQTDVQNAVIAANYPANTYHISLPEIHSQLNDMIAGGMIEQSQVNSMLQAAALIQNQIVSAVERIASITGGYVSSKTRAPGMRSPPDGQLEIQPGNLVVHEGRAW
jgi:phospholipase/lecithinase/hemolysin